MPGQDVLFDISVQRNVDHFRKVLAELRDKSKEIQAEIERNRSAMRKTPDSCAIVSGGLDSTTLVYDMLDRGYTPHLLSFDYGQRHKKELRYAANTARKLHLMHDIIDLSGITRLISNSALTSGLAKRDFKDENQFEPIIEVPDGHYAEDNMKATVVPNRNMIMLSIAAGVAVNNQYRTIGFGAHGGDHFIYPDCRPKFIFGAGMVILDGNEGFHNFWLNRDFNEAEIEEAGQEGLDLTRAKPALPIFTPYLHKTKADIAYRALELGVPLHLTWSCYKGGENHCGRCGTCVERLEAIDTAQLTYRVRHDSNDTHMDHTVYEDDEYWKQAVAQGTNS